MNESLASIEAWYTRALGEHGTASQAVGWRDAAGQMLRFDKLVEGFQLGERDGFSVNDLGCGYGAMFEYLDSAGTLTEYNGYDISEKMLAAAAIQVPDRRAHWHPDSSISTVADFSFVSGTFNVMPDQWSVDDWQSAVVRMLDNMREHSREGFAFNLLSIYVDWRQAGLFYADPGFFFDLCKRRYSKAVRLLHDYPLYEWTIAVGTPIAPAEPRG